MTESERSLAAIIVRTRVALALGILGFVGVAQQTALFPGDLLVRALVVGIALATASGLEELVARRRSRQLGATAGIVAEFFAFAIAVALYTRYTPLAPVLLVWPILTAAVLLRQLYVMYLTVLASAMVFEVELLGSGASVDLLLAGGWAALYVSLGALGGAIGASFRRAQRSTESSYASIATLSAAASYGELAQILFAYLERALDLPLDAPLALLFDERGVGSYSAIEARAIDPETRARFRVAGPSVELLQTLAGTQGVWIDPKRAFSADVLPLPGAFRSGVVFVAPLRDARRLVGFAFARRDRIRRLSPEGQAALRRLADQVATTAIRIRGAHAVELQRQAMAGFLDARGAGRSETEIAAWLARNARDVAHADGAAVLQDAPGGATRLLLNVGLASEDVPVESRGLIDDVRKRGVPVVISDGGNERRIALPPFLRTGSCAILPIPGHGAFLIVQRDERDGFSAGDLQLLVMLSDQAGLLFTRAQRTLEAPTAESASHREERLAAVAAHVQPDASSDEGAARAEERARIVDAFRLAVEGNQPQLAGSGERVAALAGAIAESLGCDGETRDAVYVGSLLRDVGELGIDRKILDTPGQLSAEQRDIIERHPILGETILVTLAFLGPAARIVKSHHERWDGSGYPSGLEGDEIPLGARIVAVADAFVAMTSDRPYRAALRSSEALAALLAGRGLAFDPGVVDALVALGDSGAISLASSP